MRQVQLQRLPVIAIIKRYPDGIFCARVKKAFAHGIFANRVDRTKIRKAGSDERPILAAVVRAVDVRVRVVDAETANRGICRLLVEV
jgi:hypothetical protein